MPLAGHMGLRLQAEWGGCMKLKVMVLLLSAALAGCVSTRDPFIEAPSKVVQSNRSAEDIDYCLANHYAVVHPAVRQRRDDGSIRVAFRNVATGWLRFAVNLVPDDEGTRVEFWKGQDGFEWVEGCL